MTCRKVREKRYGLGFQSIRECSAGVSNMERAPTEKWENSSTMATLSMASLKAMAG
jgi:hypothetical protein